MKKLSEENKKMTSVFVVDDDAIMRMSLHMMIDWENEGFVWMGEAENGKEALEHIDEIHPQIVITDVKMPGMDGVSLIRELKKYRHPPAVLVLSSYDDYELVRESMRLGASDYLLKVDLTAEKLLQALRPLQIQNDMTRNAVVPQHVLRAHLMKNIMSRFFLSEKDMREQFLQANVVFQAEHIWCMALRTDLSPECITDEGEYQTICLSLINITEEIAGDELTTFCAEGYTGEFFVLGVCDRLYDETRCIQQVADRLVLMLNQYLDLHVSIGISRGTYTIQGIFQACKSARLAAKMAIWEQKDYLFAEQAKISITESSMAYIPQLNQAIQTSNCELFKRVMQDLKTFICVQNHSLEEQKNLSSEVLMNLQESIRKSGWKKDLSAAMENTRFQELKQVSSSQKLSDWLDVLIATVCNGMQETAKRENRKESILAQDYIEQHFAENITLSALAKHLNLTPGYLSTLMKRDLGMTFSEYLLHVRMEHARRLLKQGKLHVYEVAECVGYSNQYYFNMLFKRTFGITPGQYSRSKGEKEEKI